jgi:hypothetical protein
MTDSEAIAPSPNRLRRGRAMLALLTATAALSAGAQALAPSPAMAMINLGNDCANLSGPALFECETRGAGAGGGSGGGAGGSTSADPGDQIIGEAIYVHDTRPSTGCRQSWSCLPTTPGGRHQIGSDGVRPRGPRPGGHRPVRVGEVAKGKLTKGKGKAPTKKECANAATSAASLKATFEEREHRRWDLLSNWRIASDSRAPLWDEEAHLTHRLDDLREKRNADHRQIVALEAQLAEVMQGIAAIDREIESFDRQLNAIKTEVDALISKLGAQSKRLEECDRLYPRRSEA